MVEAAKVVGIIVICFIAISITASVAWQIHSYYFEKEKAENKARSDEFYHKALETKDVSYCKQTAWDSGCVVKVGQKWNDITVCGLPELGNPKDANITSEKAFKIYCQAAILNNLTICNEFPEKYQQSLCIGYVNDRNRPREVFD